jgi:hypothetical protein
VAGAADRAHARRPSQEGGGEYKDGVDVDAADAGDEEEEDKDMMPPRRLDLDDAFALG